MNSRNKAARALSTLGCVVLSASAGIHAFAFTIISPRVSASNLSASLQRVFRVAFLDMAWHWIVLSVIVLLALFAEGRLRKALVLICGTAVLAETALTLAFVGPFIGNEMIGTAGLLIFCGGLLLEPADAVNAANTARVQSPS